jgi:hypothetical protein
LSDKDISANNDTNSIFYLMMLAAYLARVNLIGGKKSSTWLETRMAVGFAGILHSNSQAATTKQPQTLTGRGCQQIPPPIKLTPWLAPRAVLHFGHAKVSAP